MKPTPKPAPAPKAPPYKMPDVRPGQTVLWFGGRTGVEGTPAIVQAIATEMVDLLVLPAGSANGLPRTGVRHRADPNHRAIDNADMGAWDYTDGDKETLAAMRDLSELLSAHESLLVESSQRIVAAEKAIVELQATVKTLAHGTPHGATPAKDKK